MPMRAARRCRSAAISHQGLGDSTKQQSVDKTLVSECECSQLLGQGEDDMAVGHGQQTRRLLRKRQAKPMVDGFDAD
jgi:hypothetical protein